MAESQPIDVRLPPLPEHITRDTVRDVCRMLGFDPVIVREFRFSVHEATATLYLSSPDGHKIRYGEDAATTVVTIPID